MLRILVISLLVANLLLFGFQRSNPAVEAEPVVSSSVKKSSSIPTIHLFSEMMQDQDLLTGNRQCFSLGPFHSGEDRDDVRLLLQEVSTRISERQTEALVEKGYWVFIPPYGSLLEANQALISLQALGLEDLGVVFDGDWKNAISLGYFMRQENAQRRKKSLENRGFAPLMRVQRQGEPRYWLDYEQKPGSGLIKLDMQNRPNDFMQRSMPCAEEEEVEFAGADSQEPVQVTAQLQVPEDNNEPASDRSEDLDTGGEIESVPQEQVETLPDQAIETETETVIDTGQEDVIDVEPKDAVETLQEDAIGAERENAVGIGQEDAIGTDFGNAVEFGQEDVIDTEPEEAVETGQEYVIDTEPEDAVETGQEDATETETENTVEFGQEDFIGTEPENAVGTGQEDVVGTEPENAVETGQEDATGTELENTVGTGQEDVIGTEPENTVETAQDDAIEPEPRRAVGTGPLHAIDTEPESNVEDGLDDTPEDVQEPVDETGSDDTSETGTGEE